MTKPTFSQRMGLEPLEKALQLESMDDRLRNGLWNCLFNFTKYLDISFTIQNYLYSYKVERIEECNLDIIQDITDVFFGDRLYKINKDSRFPYYFEKQYNSLDWNKVYEFIEKFFELLESYSLADVIEMQSYCINSVLERESSAYRLLDGIFVPITNELESQEIEEAINEHDPFNIPSEHIKKALKKLSDRESPDYHNSIKESISAVESMCRIITKKTSLSLGDALKKMEKEGIIDLHQALSKGFSNIYGWTSDEGGIRHSQKFGEGSNVSFEDAKFMLVSASAFVNYLKEKAIKAGVDF